MKIRVNTEHRIFTYKGPNARSLYLAANTIASFMGGGNLLQVYDGDKKVYLNPHYIVSIEEDTKEPF